MALERLEEFRKFMRFQDQKDLAPILGIDPSTLHGYISGKRTPRSLKAIADCLGPSLDWLCGADVEMWGPTVRAIRPGLRMLARANSGQDLNLLQRCTLIIREIERRLPDLAGQSWFMPGLLYVSEAGYRELLDNPETELIGPQVITRLAEFTGLPELWLWQGDSEALRGLGEYAAGWEPFLAVLVERGISPQEALESVAAFIRHVESKRGLG